MLQKRYFNLPNNLITVLLINVGLSLLANNTITLAQTPPQPKLPPGILEQPHPGLPPSPQTPETPDQIPELISPLEPSTPSVSPVDLEVEIKQIKVLGSTVFSEAELQEIITPFIGKLAKFEDLLTIRTAITQLYTNKGYVTSGAFLPPQDISDGIIEIQVVEGQLEKVEINGLKRLRESYVRSRIGLASTPPIDLVRLEEALQLLQLDPLFESVVAELSAGSAPGLSVLTLNIKEAQAFSFSLVGENREAPSIGSLGGTININHNNLLGFGDRIYLELEKTAGLTNLETGYQLPVNARNGTINLSYQSSDSKIIEQPFSELDIKSDNYTFSAGFRQPIILTPATEFGLGLSLDLRQSRTFLFDDLPFSFSLGPDNGKSRITALRFSQDWVHRSANQVLAARSQFSFGLDLFDPTINDIGIDGIFVSWIGQFQLVRALTPKILLVTRLGTQLSNDSLLPLEQFAIGGMDTVRGYINNERVGDNGIVGSIETRFTIWENPDTFGSIQLVPFFDIGTVWNHQGEILDPSTLMSVGIGLRWEITPYWFALLEWGYPLNQIDQGNSLQDSGINFSLQLNPW